MKRVTLQDVILPEEKYWRLTEVWANKKRPIRNVALSKQGFRVIDPLTLTVLYEMPLVYIKSYEYGVDALKLVYTKLDGEDVQVEFRPKKSMLHNMLNFNTKLPIVVWMETLIQEIVRESSAQNSSVSTPRSIRMPDEDSGSESLASPRRNNKQYKGYKQL